MLVLCYPKCTTCQKALKWLDERGVSCTVRNIKEENPAYEELVIKGEELDHLYIAGKVVETKAKW